MHTKLMPSTTRHRLAKRRGSQPPTRTRPPAARRALWASWILVATGALGCATVGSKFPVEPVDQIVIGRTTQTDIQKMFGNPWRIGVDDGDTTWTYGHYRYKLFGRARTRDLVVRFDTGGVVVSYSFNTTEHEDRATRKDTP